MPKKPIKPVKRGARSKGVSIWITENEHKLIQSASEVTDDKPATWARKVILAKAREALGLPA